MPIVVNGKPVPIERQLRFRRTFLALLGDISQPPHDATLRVFEQHREFFQKPEEVHAAVTSSSGGSIYASGSAQPITVAASGVQAGPNVLVFPGDSETPFATVPIEDNTPVENSTPFPVTVLLASPGSYEIEVQNRQG